MGRMTQSGPDIPSGQRLAVQERLRPDGAATPCPRTLRDGPGSARLRIRVLKRENVCVEIYVLC